MKYRDVPTNISLQKECLDTAQRDLSRDVSLENYKSCSPWGFGFPLRWNKGMQSWLPLTTTKTPVQYLWSICELCQENVSKWTGSSKYLCPIGKFPVLVLFSLTLLSPSLESKSGWSLEIPVADRNGFARSPLFLVKEEGNGDPTGQKVEEFPVFICLFCFCSFPTLPLAIAALCLFYLMDCEFQDSRCSLASAVCP